MKDKAQNITYVFVCVFLLSYFLRIFNMSNEMILILGSALCGVLLTQQKKLRIDLGICLLTVALSSYYVIINGVRGLYFSILYIPLMIYELGNYTVCAADGSMKAKQKLTKLIFIMTIGYSIHGGLNSYMWYAGYAIPGTRRWPDYWNFEIVPGTQHAAYFMPAMAMFMPAILCFKNRKLLNIAMIALTIFFGYTALATKSRMTILIFGIVVLVQLLICIASKKDNLREYLKNKWLWRILILSGLAACVGWFVVKDSAVIVAFLENMSKGGGVLHNIRFQAQRLALQQIFAYPMGGNLMDLGGISHSHNLWLDMANAAGVIPFFAFVIYTIYTLYKLICVVKDNDTDLGLKLMLVGLYGAFFLYFTVEPALESSIHLVTPWIFINGLLQGYLNNK